MTLIIKHDIFKFIWIKSKIEIKAQIILIQWIIPNKNNIKINFIKIDSLEKAKNAPYIINNWANFYNGEFLSNTILNANALEKILK